MHGIPASSTPPYELNNMAANNTGAIPTTSQRRLHVAQILTRFDLYSMPDRMCRAEAFVSRRVAAMFGLTLLPGCLTALFVFLVDVLALLFNFFVVAQSDTLVVNDQGSLKLFEQLLWLAVGTVLLFAATLVLLALLSSRAHAHRHHKHHNERLFHMFAVGSARRHMRSVAVCKQTPALWETLFSNMDPGTFMVSYSWAEPTLARRLAQTVGVPLCWLDVRELMPGRNVSHSCFQAARDAKFRFVFLSGNYLCSRNCLTELSAVIGEPGRCFMFVYDTKFLSMTSSLSWQAKSSNLQPVDNLTISQLRDQGHIVYPLSDLLRAGELGVDMPFNMITAVMGTTSTWIHTPMTCLTIKQSFLLRELVATRACLHLFSACSPAINAHWFHTVSQAVSAKTNLKLPCAPTSATSAAFRVWFAAVIGAVLLCHLTVLVACAGFVLASSMLITFCITATLRVFLFGTIFRFYATHTSVMESSYGLAQLPDTALLLIFLRVLCLTHPVYVCVDTELKSLLLPYLSWFDVVRVLPRTSDRTSKRPVPMGLIPSLAPVTTANINSTTDAMEFSLANTVSEASAIATRVMKSTTNLLPQNVFRATVATAASSTTPLLQEIEDHDSNIETNNSPAQDDRCNIEPFQPPTLWIVNCDTITTSSVRPDTALQSPQPTQAQPPEEADDPQLPDLIPLQPQPSDTQPSSSQPQQAVAAQNFPSKPQAQLPEPTLAPQSMLPQPAPTPTSKPNARHVLQASTTIFWANTPPATLDSNLRQTLSDSVVSEGEPRDEVVCVKLLSMVLNCPVSNFTFGDYPFTPQGKKSPKNATDSHETCRRFFLFTVRGSFGAGMITVLLLVMVAGLFFLLAVGFFKVDYVPTKALQTPVVCTDYGCHVVEKCLFAYTRMVMVNGDVTCVSDDSHFILHQFSFLEDFVHDDVAGTVSCDYAQWSGIHTCSFSSG